MFMVEIVVVVCPHRCIVMVGSYMSLGEQNFEIRCSFQKYIFLY